MTEFRDGPAAERGVFLATGIGQLPDILTATVRATTGARDCVLRLDGAVSTAAHRDEDGAPGDPLRRALDALSLIHI